jgi:DNA-binding Lrp family transcriptional regulator
MEDAMTTVAFVLIRTETGRAFSAADAVSEIDGVTASDVVTGLYDIIAKLQAATLDDLARAVVSEVQAVDGITRTYTCPVVRL